MNLRHRTIGGVLGSAAVAVALAACGSSGGAKTADGPVQIGLLGPMTGVRASVGAGMVTGAKLALSEINSSGGLLGRKVSMQVQDTAGDPGDAVPAAEKELSNNIVAMMGPTALTASAVLPLTLKAKIPDLMWGGGSAFDHDTDPYFFRLTTSDTAMAQAMVLYAHEKGWNRVGVALGNTSADEALAPPLLATAKQLGMTVTSQVTIAINSSSFRSEITRLYSSHPQAILGQFDIPSAGVLFSELQQQGLLSTPWVASNLWYASEFYKAVGSAVASGPIYIANPGTGGPGVDAFMKALKAQTGQSQPQNGQEYEWDSVTVWALGVLEAHTFSTPAVEKGIIKAANGPGTVCYAYNTCAALLKAGKPINFDGSSSTVDFNQYHNVFGPFEMIKFTKSGAIATVNEISAKAIAQLAG